MGVLRDYSTSGIQRNTRTMKLLYTALITLLMPSMLQASAMIDRKALVQRHNITFTKPNPAEIPQVGYGGARWKTGESCRCTNDECP